MESQTLRQIKQEKEEQKFEIDLVILEFNQLSALHKHNQNGCNCCIEQDQINFFCDTCADEGSILCQPCLLNNLSYHENHQLRAVTNMMGLCDCGDISQFTKAAFCTNHQSVISESNNLNIDQLDNYFNQITKDLILFEKLYKLAVRLLIYLSCKHTSDFNNNILLQNSRILRIVCLAIFFGDSETLTINQLYNLQFDYFKLINTNICITGYFIRSIFTNKFKQQFISNIMPNDFLFRILLMKAVNMYYHNMQQTKIHDILELASALVQSQTEPLFQNNCDELQKYLAIAYNTVCYNLKEKQRFSSQQLTYMLIFQELYFCRSPVSAFSILKSPELICKYVQLQFDFQNIRCLKFQQQYENQKVIENNGIDILRLFYYTLNSFYYFLQCINIKQGDLNSFLQQKTQETISINHIDEQIHKIEHLPQYHITNITKLVHLYKQNNFFQSHAEQFMIMPISILQIYMSRIVKLYGVDFIQLIKFILQTESDDDIQVFIQNLFYDLFKSETIKQMFQQNGFCMHNQYDFSNLIHLFSNEQSLVTIQYQFYHSAQELLGYSQQSLSYYYCKIQQDLNITEQLQDKYDIAYISVFTQICFAPNPFEQQNYLQFLIATNNFNNYNQLIEGQLKKCYRVSLIEKAYNEVMRINKTEILLSNQAQLKNLDAVEPSMLILMQDSIINQLQRQYNTQNVDLKRYNESNQIINQNLKQLLNNKQSQLIRDLIIRICNQSTSISTQINCMRLCLCFDDFSIVQKPTQQIAINLFNLKQNLIKNNMYNDKQKITMKIYLKKFQIQKYQLLLNNDTQQQQISHLEDNIMCSICHDHIPNDLALLCFVVNNDKIFIRTCCHYFHFNCCKKIQKCPVCQKLSNYVFTLHNSYQLKEHFHQLIIRLCSIINDQHINQQDLFQILKQLVAEVQALTNFLVNNKKLLGQFNQLKQNLILYVNNKMQKSLLLSKLQQYSKHQYTQSILNHNFFQNSIFYYFRQIANKVKESTNICIYCGDRITVQTRTKLSLCVFCNQMYHIKCCYKQLIKPQSICIGQQKCITFFFPFFNTIMNKNQTIIGPYCTKYQIISQSMLGPESFFSESMFSLVSCFLSVHEQYLHTKFQNMCVKDWKNFYTQDLKEQTYNENITDSSFEDQYGS